MVDEFGRFCTPPGPGLSTIRSFVAQNKRFLVRACTDSRPDSKISDGIRSSDPAGEFGFQHFTVARVIPAVGGNKDEFSCEMDPGSWRLRWQRL